MNDELTRVAAAAALDEDLVDKLDKILTGPNDRAFLVCSYSDCHLNHKGQCTIFTLLDVPRMKPGQPCERYQTQKV